MPNVMEYPPKTWSGRFRQWILSLPDQMEGPGFQNKEYRKLVYEIQDVPEPLKSEILRAREVDSRLRHAQCVRADRIRDQQKAIMDRYGAEEAERVAEEESDFRRREIEIRTQVSLRRNAELARIESLTTEEERLAEDSTRFANEWLEALTRASGEVPKPTRFVNPAGLTKRISP